MSKRFGFCEAGCKREVVAKEVYDAKVADLELEINVLRTKHNEDLKALENKAVDWKAVSEGYEQIGPNEGEIYRIIKGDNGSWNCSIMIRYSIQGNYAELEIPLPEVTAKKYFDFEIVSESIVQNGHVARVEYLINGVKNTKTVETEYEVELYGVTIIAEKPIYKYDFLGGMYA